MFGQHFFSLCRSLCFKRNRDKYSNGLSDFLLLLSEEGFLFKFSFNLFNWGEFHSIFWMFTICFFGCPVIECILTIVKCHSHDCISLGNTWAANKSTNSYIQWIDRVFHDSSKKKNQLNLFFSPLEIQLLISKWFAFVWILLHCGLQINLLMDILCVNWILKKNHVCYLLVCVL